MSIPDWTGKTAIVIWYGTNDLVNNYGANGEDFLTFGYRHHF